MELLSRRLSAAAHLGPDTLFYGKMQPPNLTGCQAGVTQCTPGVLWCRAPLAHPRCGSSRARPPRPVPVRRRCHRGSSELSPHSGSASLPGLLRSRGARGLGEQAVPLDALPYATPKGFQCTWPPDCPPKPETRTRRAGRLSLKGVRVFFCGVLFWSKKEITTNSNLSAVLQTAHCWAKIISPISVNPASIRGSKAAAVFLE